MGHLKRSIGIRGLGYGMMFLAVIVATLLGATYAMADEPPVEQKVESEVKSNQKPPGMESKKGYRGKPGMAKIKKDLDIAVESGRITQKQSDERLGRLSETLKGPGKLGMTDYHEKIRHLQKEIEENVKSGELTRAEADEKHRVLRGKMKGSKKH